MVEKLRLGGMALRNGLLVHGPTHWAAAVRADDGRVKVATGRKPDLGARAAEGIPGVRGLAKLAEAMAVIPLAKRHLPEARLPMQDPKTLGAMVVATLAAQAVRGLGGRTLAGEAAVAGLGLAVVPAIAAREALAAGTLARLDVDPPPPVRMWHAWVLGDGARPIAQEFARFLADRSA